MVEVLITAWPTQMDKIGMSNCYASCSCCGERPTEAVLLTDVSPFRSRAWPLLEATPFERQLADSGSKVDDLVEVVATSEVGGFRSTGDTECAFSDA